MNTDCLLGHLPRDRLLSPLFADFACRSLAVSSTQDSTARIDGGLQSELVRCCSKPLCHCLPPTPFLPSPFPLPQWPPLSHPLDPSLCAGASKAHRSSGRPGLQEPLDGETSKPPNIGGCQESVPGHPGWHRGLAFCISFLVDVTRTT